ALSLPLFAGALAAAPDAAPLPAPGQSHGPRGDPDRPLAAFLARGSQHRYRLGAYRLAARAFSPATPVAADRLRAAAVRQRRGLARRPVHLVGRSPLSRSGAAGVGAPRRPAQRAAFRPGPRPDYADFRLPAARRAQHDNSPDCAVDSAGGSRRQPDGAG